MHIPRSADQVIERTIEEIPTLRVGQHRAWGQDIEALLLALTGGTLNTDGSIDIPDSIGPAIVQPPYVSGRWYHAGNGAVKTGTAVGVGTLKLYPFMLTRPVTITDLGARVNTATAGTFFLSIFSAHPTTLRPTGTPKVNTAGISCAVEGCFSGPVVPATLPPGLYWAGIVATNATTTFMARDTSSTEPGVLVGSATINDLMGAGQLGAFFYSTPTATDVTASTFTAFFTAAQAALLFRVA